MIKIEQHTGPFGIPILYQRLPNAVESVAMSWVVFTGSGDDESIGQPGLYHWFEHVPFRGTEKFPGGYVATKGWATRYAGKVGAYTNKQATIFHTSVPTDIWRKGLEVITDLVSEPLIKEDDVKAERDVIRMEISGAKSKAMKSAGIRINEILFGGHAFGNPVLGTESTLDSMDASTLRKAHKAGYDRSRLMLVCIGNIGIEDLQKELAKLAPLLPDNRLPERRVPADRGKLPLWKSGQTTIEETKFDSSLVFMLFPVDGKNARRSFLDGCILTDLFEFGGLASPLYRIVREERKLAYGTHATENYLHGGGYIGLFAETKRKDIDAVIAAFHDTINDPGLRSQERLDEVKEGIVNSFKMMPVNPASFVEMTIYRHASSLAVVDDGDFVEMLAGYTTKDVAALLDRMTPDIAHIVVFKGTA